MVCLGKKLGSCRLPSNGSFVFLQKNKTNFKQSLKFNSRALPHTYLVKPSGKSEYDFYRWKNRLFPKTLNLLDIAKTFDVSLDFLVGDKLI